MIKYLFETCIKYLMRPNISDRNIDRLKSYAKERMEIESDSWKRRYQESYTVRTTKGAVGEFGVTIDDVLDQLLSEAGF
jgi:hypothetical protein